MSETILGSVYERFAKEAPAAVMVRATIERCLGPEAIDQLFYNTSQKQYCRELLFSTLFEVLSEVVFNVHRSVHSSYTARSSKIGVSVGALYDKLAGVEAVVLSAVVRHTARELGSVLEQMGGALPSPLPGRPVRILDGNCPEATERRLELLRSVQDRALPGKAMVVLDPERMLILEALPCEDGHASERSLVAQVLRWVQPGELWIADRNLCFLGFVEGLDQAQAHFVLRQHGQFTVEPLEEFRQVGRNQSGTVSEQKVRVRLPCGQFREWRRIRVQLDRPTRKGEREVLLITSLSTEEADALKIAELYLGRWTIERVFQDIEANLASEINTLAYPRAALFGLCIGFVAYNVLALVMGAMRAAHGVEKVQKEISVYYLAEELENTHHGLQIAVPATTWERFRHMNSSQMARELVHLARGMDLRRYRKHVRGPKKPQPPRRRLSRGRGSHVSTARLLVGAT
jgi:IS4 transposase